ncbi:MAG: YfhO family protein, partial [Chloroflexi bacterium]|nr:YfhO family protein [Chloroflexota bacterium]
FHLPSLDGFGGGVLPTRTFVESMGLFLPPEQVVADGRLRETLRSVPDARLLSLFGVCFVITDKDFDAWVDGIYYDLTFGEALTSSQPDLQIAPLPLFPVTTVGLISYLQGGAALSNGEPVAVLDISFADGREERHLLRAGEHTAEGSDEAVGVAHRRDLPAVPWRYHAPGHDTVARVPLDHSGILRTVSIRLLRDDVTLFVRGIAFSDAVSQAHASPPVSRHSWQRIHSGDVKIYRNNAVMPRASFIPGAKLSPDDTLTLAAMQSADFDPRQTLFLAEGNSKNGGLGEVEIQEWAAEMIRLRTRAASSGTVLISDAWYPGWQATVDGEPVPIWRADLLLRAVPVPAGEHELVMQFRPRSLWLGALLSLAGLSLLLLLIFLPTKRTPISRHHPSLRS